MFNDDEITRFERALAKVVASVDKISHHIDIMGTDFALMPNPLPGAANELLSTMSALKKYRDDYESGLKSLSRLQGEAAELKQKNEGKKKSLKEREEALLRKEQDFIRRDSRREGLSSSLDDRFKELESQLAKQAEAVKAHHERVGRVNAERDSLQERERRVLEKKGKLESERKELARREQVLQQETLRQVTLSDSLDDRVRDFKSQVEAHSSAVKANAKQAGKNEENKKLLSGWEGKLGTWQDRLEAKAQKQSALEATQKGQDEHISAAQVELEKLGKELDRRGEDARAFQADIRKLFVDKLQAFSISMDMIGPAVTGLSREVENLTTARSLVSSISSDIGSIRGKTINLDHETSSLTGKLQSLRLDTRKTAVAVNQRDSDVDGLLSKLDNVKAEIKKLDGQAVAADFDQRARLNSKLKLQTNHADRILEVVDNVRENMDHMELVLDSSFARVWELVADLELLRPHVPHLFDEASKAKYKAVLQSAPLGGQPPMSPKTLAAEWTQAKAQTAVAPRSRIPVLKGSQFRRNLDQAASKPAATAHETPVVGSPQQKRKHTSAHSSSHKRHSSSQGQAPHPDSVSPERSEPLEAMASFGESSSVVVARGEEQTQTQSEAAAEPTQATSQQSGETEDIWSKLMFSPSNWAIEDQNKFRRNLDHYQGGPVAQRPLSMFDKISKRQAKGEELCWNSQSAKTKGDFTAGGRDRACSNCTRHGRLCLRIEQAPVQSGKLYLVTRRP